MPDVDDFDFRRDYADEREWSAADHEPGEVAARVVDTFNQRHPVGTPVHAYPGTRDDKPLVTRTRTEAWLLGDGTPVVKVEGYAGGIALTHIDVVVPDETDSGDHEPIPPLPKHGTPAWNDFARLANELGRAAPSLPFSERGGVALALLDSDWRKRHDAEVAASALEDARAEMRRMMDGFAMGGRHTRAAWALRWLDHIVERIRREAGQA